MRSEVFPNYCYTIYWSIVLTIFRANPSSKHVCVCVHAAKKKTVYINSHMSALRAPSAVRVCETRVVCSTQYDAEGNQS